MAAGQHVVLQKPFGFAPVSLGLGGDRIDSGGPSRDRISISQPAIAIASGRRVVKLPGMWFYRILLGIDAAAALVILYFFFVGLADGSVSSFNIALWLAILGGVAGVLGGGWALNAKGQRGAAIAVLLVLAVPAFLFGLFMLLAVLLKPRWN